MVKSSILFKCYLDPESDDHYNHLMEQQFLIPAGDGYYISGLWNKVRKKEANKVVFFFHGLSANMFEHKYMAAVPVFLKAGYDVVRVAFFSPTEDKKKPLRHFRETSLKNFTRDITATINHFRKKYQNIYAVGHSYNGLGLVMANPEGLAAMTLWDPSFDLVTLNKEYKDLYKAAPAMKCSIIDWGIELLVGPQFQAERTLTAADCHKLAAKVKTPLQVITARKSALANMPSFDQKAGGKAKRIILNASHNFTEEGMTEKLITETLKWFELSSS